MTDSRAILIGVTVGVLASILIGPSGVLVGAAVTVMLPFDDTQTED